MIDLQTKGLNLHRCDIKLEALKEFLVKNREKLVNGGVNYAKKVCDDLGIVMRRRHRNKKKKDVFGDGSQDAGLPYDIEWRTETFFFIE